MKFQEVFSGARWIGASDTDAYVAIRDSFTVNDTQNAEITILGLGRFILFINGKRVHDDYFLPLNSNFENVKRFNTPENEIMGVRAYPSKFDVSHLLHKGKNTIAVLLGGGWYTGSRTHAGATQGAYGKPKLCYRISLCDGEHLSSTNAKYSEYFLRESEYNAGEIFDFAVNGMEIVSEEYDDSSWSRCCEARALDTEYYFSDCPTDKLIRTITPVKNGLGVYDAGANLTGYPVIISGGGDIDVIVSEAINSDGTLDMEHRDFQYLQYKNTQAGQLLTPLFTWLAFRYFTVVGNAEVKQVHQIHADVKVLSRFECDDDTLNWMHDTFIHTMLSNMHEGQPSDCPQFERRGYTGDGQLTCHTVFRTLDAKAFYAKWIEDIADCQDRISGHVQNTAPYTSSGGGPGGWGIAIVKVPYEFMKSYGDEAPARKLYTQMLKYLEFMENQSEFGLVTQVLPKTAQRPADSAWCLGDWCPPETTVKIAPPFVNTYFYIKAMQMVIEMAERFGHSEDIPLLKERIEYRKSVLFAAYYNSLDGHFFGGEQGADAFALDIGIGTEKTRESFIRRYEQLDAFDTGIFGTELVVKMLFACGRGDLCCKLMTAEEPHGFGHWKKVGATTFWEYWRLPSRSLSHPMFGACVTYLFDEILGIKQDEDSIGYRSVTVKPANIPSLNRASGSIPTPYGDICVSYERRGDELDVRITAPEQITVHR